MKTLTDKHYDHCVIGGGLAGKYVHYKLKNENTLFISSSQDLYKNTDEKSSYDLNHYLGTNDTWSEKATGLISYPDFTKDKDFPIDEDTYAALAKNLKKELNVSSMKEHVSEDVVQYNDELAKQLSLPAYQYFDSSFDFDNIQSVYSRKEYDAYWFDRRNNWHVLNAEPINAYAEYFIIEEGVAVGLVYKDEDGNKGIIKAKNFIVACHTPGSIRLIKRTLLENNLHELLPYVGKGFADHAQLSFGLYMKNIVARRNLPPVMIYSDNICRDLPYRIEIHNGPPLHHHTNYSLAKHPDFYHTKESENFIRMTAVLEMPSQWNSRIDFDSATDESHVNYRISDVFQNFLNENKSKIIKHVKETHLHSEDIVLLNEQEWYFSAHIGGGLYEAQLLNKDLSLAFAQNISIASLAVMSSLGLYNPTFTLLVICHHIINNVSGKS